MAEVDLAIIGAGPAGMAAAVVAEKAGLRVVLLDEQPRPGGQIYRDVTRLRPDRARILGADYSHGRGLTTALAESGVQHIHGAVVWAVEDGFRLSYTANGTAAQASAQRVLIATGALERPVPLPGWTLPGVMTAGAAQILLKGSGIVPHRAVLAGSGPLIYLVAAQMVRAGYPPLALVETQTRRDLTRAMRHLPGALRGWRGLAKGLGLLLELRRAGVKQVTGADRLKVEGTDKAEALCFRSGGEDHRIACDTVLLHHGVVPNTQVARSLGVSHRWSSAQQAFTPVLDRWGSTDRPGVFIAGDGAGIGGAMAAEIAGRLAALKLAEEAGHLTAAERDSRAKTLFRARSGELAIRPFLDAAYPPFAEALAPADSTLICRCEEVTAGEIRRTAKLGCLGPNQAKSFTRAGMGPCQGRYCGLMVTAILSDTTGQSPDVTGYYRIRPPLKPVTLAELAAMAETGATDPEGE
ncbi:FAD-dependent oxidoreductase [Nioella sp.]|uniref:FAD/NAD(P)-dependent oxidoreductase n=1 Tax=Nioella sp. TaxID=1912091 RepID=UPI003B51723D